MLALARLRTEPTTVSRDFLHGTRHVGNSADNRPAITISNDQWRALRLTDLCEQVFALTGLAGICCGQSLLAPVGRSKGQISVRLPY